MYEIVQWGVKSGKLKIAQCDLTGMKVDAIVNAANSSLAGGGGVDGAIHREAGPELLDACMEIIRRIGSLPPGEAVVTPGFRLKARYVIHTVGPIWMGGKTGEDRILRAAYRNSLGLVQANGLTSVAFPAISCGSYGYPVKEASKIALGEIREGLITGLAGEVFVCLFSVQAMDIWKKSALEVFGTDFDRL